MRKLIILNIYTCIYINNSLIYNLKSIFKYINNSLNILNLTHIIIYCFNLLMIIPTKYSYIRIYLFSIKNLEYTFFKFFLKYEALVHHTFLVRTSTIYLFIFPIIRTHSFFFACCVSFFYYNSLFGTYVAISSTFNTPFLNFGCDRIC